jgi:hypothetical protein
MAATKLEGLPPDVLTAIIKSLPAGERHSSIPLVCQSLRAAAYTAAADDSPVTLRLRGERPAATLASFQRWLSHHGAASNISSLVIERECSPVVSPSVQLPAVALPSLHALRLVNAGDMEDLLPQLGKLKCLSSLELTGSNHGTRRADGRPAPITLGAWHQLLHAAQLTRLVLIQCLTERESISLMLEHLTALQELELSYTQHAFRCGDPWLMRGRLVRVGRATQDRRAAALNHAVLCAGLQGVLQRPHCCNQRHACMCCAAHAAGLRLRAGLCRLCCAGHRHPLIAPCGLHMCCIPLAMHTRH